MALRVTRNLGMLLLGVWLFVTGLSGMIAVPIPGIAMEVVALIAGIAILLGR